MVEGNVKWSATELAALVAGDVPSVPRSRGSRYGSVGYGWHVVDGDVSRDCWGRVDRGGERMAAAGKRQSGGKLAQATGESAEAGRREVVRGAGEAGDATLGLQQH